MLVLTTQNTLTQTNEASNDKYVSYISVSLHSLKWRSVQECQRDRIKKDKRVCRQETTSAFDFHELTESEMPFGIDVISHPDSPRGIFMSSHNPPNGFSFWLRAKTCQERFNKITHSDNCIFSWSFQMPRQEAGKIATRKANQSHRI